MYDEELENLIDAALTDGVLTDKERQILEDKAFFKYKIMPDEFEIVLDARLAKAKQAQQQAQQLTLETNEKLGNLATCPNCGAPVLGGAVKCPECGYEFRNAIANRSMQRFSEGLQTTHDAKNFISTFPVPNTADDLLEFLSFVQGQARKHNLKLVNRPENDAIIEHAYWTLYECCINKSKINFANDPRFIPFFEYYKKQKRKITPEGKVILGVILFFVAWAIFVVIMAITH